VKIILAEQGIYAAIIDGKVAVKLGAKDWNPGPEELKFRFWKAYLRLRKVRAEVRV